MPRSMTNGLHIFSQMEKNGLGLGGYDDLPNLISLCSLSQDTTRMPLPMAVNENYASLSREKPWYFDYRYQQVIEQSLS